MRLFQSLPIDDILSELLENGATFNAAVCEPRKKPKHRVESRVEVVAVDTNRVSLFPVLLRLPFPVSNKNNEKSGVRFPKAGGLWKSRTYRMPMSMNFG